MVARSMITRLDFRVPVKTVSEANQREHWAVRLKRKKAQQQEMLVALQNNLRGRRFDFPCTVKLTRIGARRLDSDNLAGSFKHVQDAIAAKLGVDDGDLTKIKWEYHQMPIRIREYGVKVEITSDTWAGSPPEKRRQCADSTLKQVTPTVGGNSNPT